MLKLSTWLLAGGSIAALLPACDEPRPPPADQAIYANYQQCLADNPAATCAAALAAARNMQLASAPHYTSRYDCEVQYGPGRCDAGAGGSFFFPMMMGFMLGQGTYNHPQYYPVYYTRAGAVYSGRTIVTHVDPVLVSRGGFGVTALHVTPMVSSGIPLRSPSSYGSYRSGTGYYSSSSMSSRGYSSYGSTSSSSSSSVSRGGFGDSAGAHGGFGGG